MHTSEAAMDAENNFIENLINTVKNYKCLYDKRDAFYYNRKIKKKAWKDIAEKCIKSVEDCKHRWKLLRESFVKELKKMEAPSGSGMYYLEEWVYLQSLMFLKDSLAPRRTRDNAEEVEFEILSEPVDCIEVSLLGPPPKKKKKGDLDSLYQKFGETIEKMEKSFSNSIEGNSLDDVFFATASCLMRELPEAVKEEFK